MKVTIKQMQEIQRQGTAHIDMRIAKSGNRFIVSYDEQSRSLGAKEILLAVTAEYNNNLSNVQIIKGEAPAGEFALPTITIIDNKNNTYIYDNIDPTKALEIYNQHAINNKVVSALLKSEVPSVK